MSPALAGALAGLAELIPERVRCAEQHAAYVEVCGGLLCAGFEGVDPALIELALREEIEARGLFYSQHSTPQDGSGTGRVYVAEIGSHSAHGDSPAHALALALLAALKVEA